MAAVLTALLVSVPAVSVAGGPDALSIAKRALRAAEKPPKIKYVFSSVRQGNIGDLTIKAQCPRGMLPVGVMPDSGPTTFLSSNLGPARRGIATFRATQTLDRIDSPSITVACIEGVRLKGAD